MSPMETENNSTPIEVKHLSKSFGAQKVLNGIDLSVARGETLAVLGRSGTGKSVLLKLLIGLQKPDAGSIRIHGKEITGLDRKQLNEVRKTVGFLFQQAALYDSMTVGQNVEFPLSRHTGLSADELKNRARELLASVGMDKDLEKMPSEISGGMQKRVGLARAIALEPGIVLFDEPTAGLDPITGAEIGQLISQLKGKYQMASIVVTHDIHGAKQFSDRVVMLNEGNILIEGTFADLEKSKDKFVAQFLSNAA